MAVGDSFFKPKTAIFTNLTKKSSPPKAQAAQDGLT
jgi:hypothetical protein